MFLTKNGKTKYFFTYFNNKAICLICHDSVAVLKEYNIKRHFDSKHHGYNLELTSEVRSKKKSEGYDIPIEKRIRRKKRMADEMVTDAGLTLTAENQKDMLECLDRFSTELRTRSKSIEDVASSFELVQTNTLLSANIEELKLAVSKFTGFYDEVSEAELLLEVPKLRRHLKAANVTVSDWVSVDFLKFIVEWDFTESLPNLIVALKLFMTICVSVASCERSFSKLKLIKNY